MCQDRKSRALACLGKLWVILWVVQEHKAFKGAMQEAGWGHFHFSADLHK